MHEVRLLAVVLGFCATLASVASPARAADKN